ncbi:MAG TPA: hypothetical protein VLH79_02080 [Chthonomonadales bacterium]|nr:hypothetical protein [Chthonomonadales bacterium]
MKRGWGASLALSVVLSVMLAGCGGGGKAPYVPCLQHNVQGTFALLDLTGGDDPPVFRVTSKHSVSIPIGMRVQWKGSTRPVTISTAWVGEAPYSAKVVTDHTEMSAAAPWYADFIVTVVTHPSTAPGDYTLRVTGHDGVHTRSRDFVFRFDRPG